MTGVAVRGPPLEAAADMAGAPVHVASLGHALHRGGRVPGRGRRDIDHLAKGAEGMCVNTYWRVLSTQKSTI
jgi:hypothetical protein